jgi:DNA-binding beta-propeller fold protein YncE
MPYIRCLAAVCLAGALSTPALAFDGWHQVSATTIEGKPSTFDYISFDAATNHLFLGHRKEGLQVFDPAARKLVTTIGDTTAHSSNGATLMPEFDLGIANNEDGTITPFKLSTLSAEPSVKVAEELDTSHYDPASKRIFVNAAVKDDGQEIVALEAPSLKVAGTLRLASKKIEGADADGKGRLFVAEQDMGKVAVIDTKAMKVTAEWPVEGCEKPTAIVTNSNDDRLFVACRQGKTTAPALVVLNMTTGAAVYSSRIGDGVDGIVLDTDRKRVFVPAGVSATLSVFAIEGADVYKPVETLATRQWVKVLAYDAKAQVLYSMVAEGSADAAKKINTAVSPFYPNTVFANTFAVLSYSK